MKKALSLLLVLVMVLAIIPLTAFAEGTGTEDDPIVVTTSQSGAIGEGGSTWVKVVAEKNCLVTVQTYTEGNTVSKDGEELDLIADGGRYYATFYLDADEEALLQISGEGSYYIQIDNEGSMNYPMALYSFPVEVTHGGYNGVYYSFFSRMGGDFVLEITSDSAEDVFQVRTESGYAESENGKAELNVTVDYTGLTFYLFNYSENEHTYTIDLKEAPAPVGTLDNPDVLELGDSVASTNYDGYYYNWTATADGTLTVEMTGDDWYFLLNNVTASIGREAHGSGDEVVVASDSVPVSTGDLVELFVSTWSFASDPVDVPFTVTFTPDSASEEPEEPVWTPYKNVVTPDPTYSLIIYEDLNQTLVDLDVVNNEYTVVVDKYGYYHLDSVDGPVVLVNFNDDDLAINDLLATRHAFRTPVYDEDLNVLALIDFTEAVDAYIACSDQGYYPLTTDLAYMLQTYGVNQGLWGDVPGFSLYGEDVGEDVWLFACAYVQDCTHEHLQHWDALEPGCHDDGNIEYWYCPDCHTYWQDEALTQLTNSKNIIIPALGSDNVIHVEAVAPTATENGNIEYWYCPDCGRYWQDEALTQLTNAKRVILGATGEPEVDPSNPQTGDTFQLTTLVAVMVLSVAGTAAIVVNKKRFF